MWNLGEAHAGERRREVTVRQRRRTAGHSPKPTGAKSAKIQQYSLLFISRGCYFTKLIINLPKFDIIKLIINNVLSR